MIPSPELWVAVLQLELGIPGARSLKDRRQAVRSLRARLENNFGAAISEIGGAESWTRAALGVALVSNEKEELEQRVDALIRYAQRDADALVGRVEKDVFRYEAEAHTPD